jgi:hypothetical protein
MTPEIMRRHNALVKSKECKLVNQVMRIRPTLEILKGNFSELKRHLDSHSDLRDNKSFSPRTMEGKIELGVYLKELNRLTHNYITSAKTVVDHQRKLVDNLFSNKADFPEYSIEIELRFKNSPLHNFIQQLRNYILHFGLPEITSLKVFNGITGEYFSVVKLSKESLLKYDGWNENAKGYINSLPEENNYLNIIEEYNLKVQNFQEWFDEKMKSLFSTEFQFVEKESMEIKKEYLSIAFLNFRSGGSINKAMIEDIFLRILDPDDVKSYFKATDDKNKAKILVMSLKKISKIPPEVYFITMDLYGALHPEDKFKSS